MQAAERRRARRYLLLAGIFTLLGVSYGFARDVLYTRLVRGAAQKILNGLGSLNVERIGLSDANARRDHAPRRRSRHAEAPDAKDLLPCRARGPHPRRPSPARSSPAAREAGPPPSRSLHPPRRR